MVHQGIERRDGVQAQLDWEALSLAKISAVPMLSSVGARSSHPNRLLIKSVSGRRLLFGLSGLSRLFG
jgi:hypothetical protein